MNVSSNSEGTRPDRAKAGCAPITCCHHKAGAPASLQTLAALGFTSYDLALDDTANLFEDD
jgi:hypothetical protein